MDTSNSTDRGLRLLRRMIADGEAVPAQIIAAFGLGDELLAYVCGQVDPNLDYMKGFTHNLEDKALHSVLEATDLSPKNGQLLLLEEFYIKEVTSPQHLGGNTVGKLEVHLTRDALLFVWVKWRPEVNRPDQAWIIVPAALSDYVSEAVGSYTLRYCSSGEIPIDLSTAVARSVVWAFKESIRSKRARVEDEQRKLDRLMPFFA